jgi:peptide methionine sulfoxide reductase msrA/msrB
MKIAITVLIALSVLLAGCTIAGKQTGTMADKTGEQTVANDATDATADAASDSGMVEQTTLTAKEAMQAAEEGTLKTAIFAGGCFWCMESGFEAQPGVAQVISGYTGGDETEPDYYDVASGKTGHREAVKVYYDPEQISYEQLLESFWIQIDPIDAGGQFADRGHQYTTAIYYGTEEERMLADASKAAIAKKFDDPIATVIVPEQPFYAADESHQDYYKKQQFSYKTYEKLSGRSDFVEENKKRLAKKPDTEEAKKMLTPIQYKVTYKNGTEPAFNNEYWDNKADGIYVDVVTGEPLFSSLDKYDSGTGWPSFTKPIDDSMVVRKEDNSLFMERTEVRSASGDIHLGHVFNDGPPKAGSERFCTNSAALRFVPLEDMEAEGYEEYLYLFENKTDNNQSEQ